MGYTREQWSRAFLAAIGNPAPSQTTVNWVVAWTQFETSCCGGCSYNLLNTEESNAQGITGNCNQAGVKNFDSFANGIAANAKVLTNGLYSPLLAALRGNDTTALCNPSGGIAASLGTWGTGNAAAIAAAGCSGNVQSSQSFSGTATNVNPAASVGSQQPCRPGPGGCPTNEECVQLNSDGSVIPCIGINCVCVSNDYAKSHTPAGVAGPNNPLGFLPAWITDPNRLVKIVFGVIAISIAILVAFWPEEAAVAKAAVL